MAVILSILLVSTLTIISGLKVKKLSFALTTMLVAFLSIFSGCNIAKDVEQPVNVVLPSVSRDMRISINNTFASTIVLNSTSVRLARVNTHLALTSDILENYKSDSNSLNYTFKLKDDYKSFRGESITAEDVLHSIKLFKVYNDKLLSFINNIEGLNNCKSMSCKVEGFKVTSPYSFTIKLLKPDSSLIEKMSNPWFVLFKKNRPTEEKIGDCVLPYQTGATSVVECNSRYVELKNREKTLRLYTDAKDVGSDNYIVLTPDNPDTSTYATLTVMAAYFNPKAKIPEDIRVRLFKNLRAVSSEAARELKLSYSKTITPKWISVEVDENLFKESVKQFSCPKDPINVLLDTSLPNHEILKKYIRKASNCNFQFNITTADKYFVNFEKNDFGVAWFTPDYLDVDNVFAPFDCSIQCYFDWKDTELQKLLKIVYDHGVGTKAQTISILNVEKHFYDKGYAAPIADMNWWMVSNKTGENRPIHPAGLFQVAAEDFLWK